MKKKLTSAAVVAALISSSAVAAAQEANAKPSASQDQHQQSQQKADQQDVDRQRADQQSADQQSVEQQRADQQRADQQKADQQKTKEDARRFGEAVGTATTTAATRIAEVTGELTRAADERGRYNTVAIELNPLGLLVGGRVSVNVEYAPVAHHVLVVSPHFVRTSATVNVGPAQTIDQTFTGAGGEIGYRYYSGHNGMNGIFIGPSLVGGVYNASFPGRDTAFTNIGIAADVGYQQVLMDHLALGAGVGLEYLHVSEQFNDLPAGPSTIATSGLKPRLLAQIGYAF